MHFKERGRKAAGEREAERQMQQNITVLRGSFAILFAAQRCKPVAKKHFPRKLLRERRKAKKNRQQQLLGKHWKSFPESKVLW